MTLAWNLARREMRGGLGGLRLLAVCLFLGVLALAGVGSLSSSIIGGLSSQGQTILGGDLEVRLTQREATPAERAAIRQLGQTADVIRMRAMVRTISAKELLGELKAVDGNWPLYGTASLRGSAPSNATVQTALSKGAVIGEGLADQLGLKVGDTIALGEARFPVTGILDAEPDRAGEGFTLGPTVLIRTDALARTGLLQPGSLYRAHIRVKMPANADVAAATERLKAQFPDAGWRIADRSDGAPGVRRFVERLGQFLSLVSLTALAVAGVGVGNGVASYLDRKSTTIATLKTMGASSKLIVRSYLLQIGSVALVAAAAGALVGAFIPQLVVALAGDALPVPPALGFYPLPLLAAIGFGLLVALAFALPPLARAGALPAARLFRGGVEQWPWPSRRTLALAFAAAALVCALAIAQSSEPLFAAGFLAAAAALLLLLWALAWAIRRAAAALPRPRGVLARLALANLHRPGSMTRQLVVALGLGLTLFATLALIETSFRGEIARTVPAKAPGYFVLDLPKEDEAAFRAKVNGIAPGADLRMVPSLRGPVTAVNGTPVSEMKNIPEGAWILRGDRGLTFSADIPPGNSVVAGRWWSPGYAGPPLVSLDAEAAAQLGLKVGDSITVSVLGTEITATIANLRRIDWDSLGFNFVLVFDPNTLAPAPFTWMATVSPEASQDAGFTRAISAAFPTSSVVKVKDVLGQVSTLLTQMGTAIRAAASVAILAGIAVLIGALAAQARARIYDSVILKLLGATGGQILRSALLEYAALGLIVAGLALGLGTLAGWFTVTRVLQFTWQPDWGVALLTVFAGAAVTLLFGMAGAARALGAKVNGVLREL
ncbi:ABC transporter permease [Sandaracinobacteroides saxicola]|uniref:FtsX-like permease family protein n=1 Tax=Sandaracinobacteroides saxicola TaxID=2759707 RepID=A0A7G5IET3_9SPHN|nr:FtsX-like permease family protein [Sandaracinobacteroides saxicola]QMW21875.1 FtsX-like permease family protein [Sandaracinobacteroides saxicola]